MAGTKLRILICGGGIAGCSAAIALSERGHSVEIVEKQDAWRFQSSGIFVYANGLVSFEKLGLLEQILAAGFAIPDGRNIYYDHLGAPLVETIYPTAANGRIPAILGIKRAEMHRVMAARVEALGVPITLGTTLNSIGYGQTGITAEFSNGLAETYDLIVGADGLRSATRRLIGIDVEPRCTGFGVWRSVHRRPADLTHKIMMMGEAKRFGIMPISEDLLYTFGTVAEPQGRYYPPDAWPEEMRRRFSEFAGPAAPFLRALGPGSEILYTAIEEVALPLPWHRGRVVLIGDAAHASTPFMGQGGAMALQDAVVLAEALELQEDLGAALTLFGKVRQPVCQFVQNASRRVGEAGAQESEGHDAVRSTQFVNSAQVNVDQFYGRFAEMVAFGDALLAN